MKAEDQDELVPVFIPSLRDLLTEIERSHGRPLTEEEVIEIRDNATVVVVTPSRAVALEESRGYRDLDPEVVWEQWSELKRVKKWGSS